MKGSTVRRGKTWSAVVDVGVDENGRRRQRWYGGFRTKHLAELRLAELVGQVNSNTYSDTGVMTVQDYLDGWLKGRKPNLAAATYENYVLIVRSRVNPRIGGLKFRDLRARHVARIYSDLIGAGRSSKTALNTHRVLSQALKAAVRAGLLAVNPCVAVEAPRPRRYVASIPDTEELARILSAADETRLGPLVRFAVLSGARQGELLSAVWRDIDTTARVWRVRGTKTRGSLRTIDLGDDALELLRVHRQAQREQGLLFGASALFAGDDALVFTSEVGTALNRHNLSRRDWKRIIERAAVRPYRFHDLRHACASLLIGAGIPLPVVSQRLGHTRVSTTSDVYGHLLSGQGAAAATLLEDLIAGRKEIVR
jgi:integrase